MQKEFNITGTCIHKMHYMVDISSKINALMQLIEKGKYFTINRPRQYGKTTTFSHLEKALLKNPDYLVSSISFEGLGVEAYQNSEIFITQLLELLIKQFKFQNKIKYIDFIQGYKEVKNFSQLSNLITELVSFEKTKMVLLIDEVDKSTNNQLFLDFLGLLRNKYLLRNDGKDFTFHSVILAGVHDVKTLKLKLRPDAEQKFNSPWNIATDFKVDMSFNPAEIATMLTDYVNEKNVKMDIPAFADKIFFYTSGYPFLVSKLCKMMDEDILPEKKENRWDLNDLDLVFNKLIFETNTNFDSLTKNIENNDELYDFVKRIIIDGDQIMFLPADPIISFGIMYGILMEENGKCKIHNHVYQQLLYNYMMMRIIRQNKIKKSDDYNFIDNFVTADKGLNFEKIVLKFQLFMKEQFSAKDKTFLENNGRLIFLAFLKPITNGYGFDFKEVQVSEERRLDVAVTFLNKKYIVELKVWRGESYHRKGLKQLSSYLEKQNLHRGYLVIFNFTKTKKWKRDRKKVGGKEIFMVWV